MNLRFCGPKCSHCCFVLSIWGIIMLVILGALFNGHSRALRADVKEKTFKGMEDVGMNCYIAAGLYAGTLLISYWQMYLNKKKAQAEISQIPAAYTSY